MVALVSVQRFVIRTSMSPAAKSKVLHIIFFLYFVLLVLLSLYIHVQPFTCTCVATMRERTNETSIGERLASAGWIARFPSGRRWDVGVSEYQRHGVLNETIAIVIAQLVMMTIGGGGGGTGIVRPG